MSRVLALAVVAAVDAAARRAARGAGDSGAAGGVAVCGVGLRAAAGFRVALRTPERPARLHRARPHPAPGRRGAGPACRRPERGTGRGRIGLDDGGDGAARRRRRARLRRARRRDRRPGAPGFRRAVPGGARSWCSTRVPSRWIGGWSLLASILFEPRFDEARVEQAKENLRISLLAEADDPRAVLEREWLRLVHGPASPRSRRLTDASVAAFRSGCSVSVSTGGTGGRRER